MITFEQTRCLLCGRVGYTKNYGDGLIAVTKDLEIKLFPEGDEHGYEFLCKCGGSVYRTDCESVPADVEWSG